MFCQADCERRERQRQKKSDRSAAFPGAARRELFRGVEPEARRNMPAAARRDQTGAGLKDRGDNLSGHLKAAPTIKVRQV